jgi:hypothetical protein
VGNVTGADLVNLTLDRADGIPAQFAEPNSTTDSGPDWLAFSAWPGSYWIDAYLPRRGWCASSFNTGGLNLAHDPLSIGFSAATPPMELALTDNCATLALNLPAGVATFVPGEEPFYFVYCAGLRYARVYPAHDDPSVLRLHAHRRRAHAGQLSRVHVQRAGAF